MSMDQVAKIESECGLVSDKDAQYVVKPTNDTQLRIGYVSTVQKITKEILEMGLELGDTYDEITGRKLTSFIPLLVKTEYVLMNDDNTGAIWATTNPTQEQIDVCTPRYKGHRPDGHIALNFLCLFEGISSPRIFTFKRTSYYTGKRIYDHAASLGVPLFYYGFCLDNPKIETKGTAEYAILKLKRTTQPLYENEDLMDVCRALIEKYGPTFLAENETGNSEPAVEQEEESPFAV